MVDHPPLPRADWPEPMRLTGAPVYHLYSTLRRCNVNGGQSIAGDLPRGCPLTGDVADETGLEHPPGVRHDLVRTDAPLRRQHLDPVQGIFRSHTGGRCLARVAGFDLVELWWPSPHVLDGLTAVSRSRQHPRPGSASGAAEPVWRRYRSRRPWSADGSRSCALFRTVNSRRAGSSLVLLGARKAHVLSGRVPFGMLA